MFDQGGKKSIDLETLSEDKRQVPITGIGLTSELQSAHLSRIYEMPDP